MVKNHDVEERKTAFVDAQTRYDFCRAHDRASHLRRLPGGRDFRYESLE